MIARRLLAASLLAFAVPVSVSAAATKATAAKPADATAQCSDGTYSKAKTKQGACSSHGGVKTWYADEATAAAPVAPAAPPSPATTATKTVRAPQPARTSAPATPAPPAATDAPPAPVPTATPKPTGAAPTTGTAANATAKCKDGTFSYAKQHSGACSHHGGVAEWYK